MLGVQVEVVDGPQTQASQQGWYFFEDLPPGEQVTIQSRLVGEWVTVHRDDGFDNLVVSQEAMPPQADVNLVFNPLPELPEWPSEEDTAQVNAYTTVEAAHDWFKALQPSFTGIDRSVLCLVNHTLICEAYNQVVLDIILLGTSCKVEDGCLPEISCRNPAFSTIIAHEYGHSIVHWIVGYLGEEFLFRSFHEGAADTISALVFNTHLLGLGYLPYGPDPIRDLDEPNVQLDCSIGGGHYTCSPWSPHCCGLALGGAFWDLRKDIGDVATERLFSDFLFVTDGRLDQSVLLEVLIADDDNADLSDGTPHYDQIRHAFVELHGWEDP